MFRSNRSSCSHRVMQAESSEGLLQRRAEVRRRKLLLNSEQRMKKIVGFSQNEADRPRVLEPRFHLDLECNEPWSSSCSSNRLSPLVSDPSESSGEEDVSGGVQQRLAGSPRRGLQKYVSRFDDAMKLRGQLSAEKTAQDGGGEELDSFCVFRLVCSVALAVFVRIFVCQYLSIFAPFLTLELGFMGLHKYFPKVEKKSQSTMLTAALLLSGIPAEVISRSTDTYRKMSGIFSDLCVYFFSFITCHELLLLLGSDMS
ncbi:calcium signal-modulating cyclophilin ligand-like isoform X2 [Sinocyclocheilus anshuiensis]|uniref:calcium signal-modulating cyclophilin ligand-like isoform X2 n=1 Tax=Sinocyclocheilus anshuiensis TaxID=1608454 RepID=UPI0007B83B75|nr:PREDICTED: calcium signal-modulating cyclophilin ligand-like isoform X2 [Sinocyclocheilus anshuiensis]